MIARSLPALCSLLAGGTVLCGLAFLDTPVAAAVEGPEAPITEVCRGAIAAGSHQICGTLNPNATARSGYYFAYAAGPNCVGAEGRTTPTSAEVEGQAIKVLGGLSGLQPDSQYAYCLVATNPHGNTFGEPRLFVTEPEPPAINGESAGAITQLGAVLEAQVNPANQQTSYSFEYATSSALLGANSVSGGTVPASASDESASSAIAGLAPSTTYYFRITVANPTGTTEGPVQSFTTLAQPPSLPSTQAPGVASTPILGLSGGMPASSAPFLVPYGMPSGSAGQPSKLKSAPLTNAQRLAKATVACKREPKKQRSRCLREAREKYGSARPRHKAR
jgi:hypothetical protein